MTHTGIIGSSGTAMVVLALLACMALIVIPVSAATKYPGGAPSFSAAVTGVNEFSPGEDATISILVKNSAINPMKQLNRDTIEPEDLPNTAKTVTIGLASDSDALIIKTDPQMVGDIPGNGNTITVQFKVKITTNATAGEYHLPLSIRYQYTRVVDQEVADIFQFMYYQAEDTLPVTIRIKPHMKIDVIEVIPEQLSAGSQGYLYLKIRNLGPENGEMAAVNLLRNGLSPLIPTDSTIFVGNFLSGGIIECRYKVSVSKDATNQTYPVDVAVTYTNREGTIITSPSATVGVPVKGKTAFSVISPVSEVPQGTGKTIEIQYRNEGGVTVYKAQARIAPHDPVAINDNTAFLGNIGRGETAIARYEIQADAAAKPMVYTFDSNIRYRDALGNSLESDTIPVQIAVVPASSGTSAIPGGFFALVGCVLAGSVISIALLVYRRKKKSR